MSIEYYEGRTKYRELSLSIICAKEMLIYSILELFMIILTLII